MTQEEKVEYCRQCPHRKENDENITYCELEQKSISWIIAHEDSKCPKGNW